MTRTILICTSGTWGWKSSLNQFSKEICDPKFQLLISCNKITYKLKIKPDPLLPQEIRTHMNMEGGWGRGSGRRNSASDLHTAENYNDEKIIDHWRISIHLHILQHCFCFWRAVYLGPIGYISPRIENIEHRPKWIYIHL